ncbi:MAG: hypothetical protein HZC36_05660 [Armatimonadetes bacterium]|nr:hypothetical protein [Armatimonadota bacterium]
MRRGVPNGVEEQIFLALKVCKQQDYRTTATLLDCIDHLWHLSLDLLKHFDWNSPHASNLSIGDVRGKPLRP